ncbi:MAG: hypothetical protein IPJ08_18360 [Burkholderiales bacterium]|nr:hypothetical protein [Burkholderiales bacterium]
MIVEVIRMRVKGERLEKHALQSARPVRGTLSVNTRLGRGTNEQVVIATLTGDTLGQFALPALDHVRITRMRGDNFILFGWEEVELPVRQVQTFPQAWWCRPVAAPVRDGSDGDDEFYATSELATA